MTYPGAFAETGGKMDIQFTTQILKEGDTFVAYAPELDLKRDYLRSILQPANLKASYPDWGQMSSLVFGPGSSWHNRALSDTARLKMTIQGRAGLPDGR